MTMTMAEFDQQKIIWERGVAMITRCIEKVGLLTTVSFSVFSCGCFLRDFDTFDEAVLLALSVTH